LPSSAGYCPSETRPRPPRSAPRTSSQPRTYGRSYTNLLVVDYPIGTGYSTSCEGSMHRTRAPALTSTLTRSCRASFTGIPSSSLECTFTWMTDAHLILLDVKIGCCSRANNRKQRLVFSSLSYGGPRVLHLVHNLVSQLNQPPPKSDWGQRRPHGHREPVRRGYSGAVSR